MPLYEYRCRECGHVFEVMRKVSAAPLRSCERCKGKVEKLISRTSFQLKGGGWFSQGYAPGTPSAKRDSATAEKPEKKDAAAGAASKGKSGKTD